MIRWGILGLGNMGNHFSNAAKEVNDIKINGIAQTANLDCAAFKVESG